MSQQHLRGIIPPVITPMTSERAIDEGSFKRHVTQLLDAGVHGLWVNGSTGEYHALDCDQRLRAVELAAQAAGDSVPVVAHVGDTSTGRTIRQAEQALEAGASHLAMVPPYYVDFTEQELCDHYRAVSVAVERPVVVYHIPQLTKVSPGRDSILRLVGEGVVSGIKDSASDMTRFRQLIRGAELAKVDLRCFTGGSSVTDLGLFLGGAGAMPSVANLTPRYHVAMYAAATTGEWDRLRSMQEQLEALVEAMRLPRRTGTWSAGVAACKHLLAALSRIDNDDAAAPLTPLAEDERRRLATEAIPIIEQLERVVLE